ncbi:hypothetical protein K1T71_006861 [Dendrolimus kikuchii]|uniref:Uncharacterized protein n=1 Tax=Dendrolimus kikuchii TaxID=765133 RepID=A0ACC1D314_9NEOP|nr:hypothetical protein K1T71_006861 [Dendrolimus kikuchii]
MKIFAFTILLISFIAMVMGARPAPNARQQHGDPTIPDLKHSESPHPHIQDSMERQL